MKWKILKKKIEEIYLSAKGEKFNLACCDCGLVHTIGIALEKNGKRISMAFIRNEKLTKRNRNIWKKPPKETE